MVYGREEVKFRFVVANISKNKTRGVECVFSGDNLK
jgi:hypothetical protein